MHNTLLTIIDNTNTRPTKCKWGTYPLSTLTSGTLTAVTDHIIISFRFALALTRIALPDIIL